MGCLLVRTNGREHAGDRVRARVSEIEQKWGRRRGRGGSALVRWRDEWVRARQRSVRARWNERGERARMRARWQSAHAMAVWVSNRARGT